MHIQINIAAGSSLPGKARNRPTTPARQSCLPSLQSVLTSPVHHEEMKNTLGNSEPICAQKEDSASGHVKVMPSDRTYEQQEQLMVLHEKFKEEVNQHLLGCKNSLKDFEAYHTELEGVADKQKASHKKLLQHAEKTVCSQLNDAEIKMAEVQERARKKMNGLKYVLTELVMETAD